MKKWISRTLTVTVAMALMLMAAQTTVTHASGPDDPLGEPDWFEDWYEGEEDWDDLPQEDDGDPATPDQKQVYSDLIDSYDTSIRVQRLTYRTVRKLFIDGDEDGNDPVGDLETAIDAVGGAGAPGDIPEPPANPDNDAAWDDWEQDMQAWNQEFLDWFGGLTPAQRATLEPKFIEMIAVATTVTSVRGAREVAQAERDIVDGHKTLHCAEVDD